MGQNQLINAVGVMSDLLKAAFRFAMSERLGFTKNNQIPFLTHSGRE
jgi:hypothetical protein